MNGRMLRTVLGIGLLILSLVLAARGAGSVGAAPLPPIATPTTAQVSIVQYQTMVNTTTGESFEVTASGQGAIDNARQAMQLSYEMQLPDVPGSTAPLSGAVTIAMVAVDNRLYMLDPTTQQWTWTELPAGLITQQIAPDFNEFGTALGSDFAFTQVGTEEVNGAATTHWQLTFDLAEIFAAILDDPAFEAEPSDSPMPEMMVSYDIWIGVADDYLHRLSTRMNFSSPEDDGEAGFSYAMMMMMTYSNFDQPVEIVAPADATPADGDGSDFATGVFPSLFGTPFDSSLFGLTGGTAAGEEPGASDTGTAAPWAPVASPTPRRNNGGIVIATAEPTATAKPSPTPTVAPTATPTAPPPTATPAIVANASLPPTVAAQPQTAAAPAAQESATTTARSNTIPLVAGGAALVLLLALSGGLIIAGRRMG